MSIEAAANTALGLAHCLQWDPSLRVEHALIKGPVFRVCVGN